MRPGGVRHQGQQENAVHQLIENKGASPIYHGNTMIPPGESRMVEVAGAAAAPAVPEAPSLQDLLMALLAKPIAAITPEIPGMSNEALELAYALEQEGKKRLTLLSALQDESLRRADDKLRQEEAAKAAAALQAAQDELDAARAALAALPVTAPEADRAAAVATVEEAEAKVTALTPAE